MLHYSASLRSSIRGEVTLQRYRSTHSLPMLSLAIKQAYVESVYRNHRNGYYLRYRLRYRFRSQLLHKTVHQCRQCRRICPEGVTILTPFYFEGQIFSQ